MEISRRRAWIASGAILTDGTSAYCRHSRESGNPGQPNTSPAALGPRLRRGDGKEEVGTICLLRTTSGSRETRFVEVED